MKRTFLIDCGYTTFNVHEITGLTNLGETDFGDHTVSILKGLSDKVYLEVLWHEILHIILELSGYGGHPEDDDTRSELIVTNEELATRLARTFLLIFKLNPHLGEYVNAGK